MIIEPQKKTYKDFTNALDDFKKLVLTSSSTGEFAINCILYSHGEFLESKFRDFLVNVLTHYNSISRKELEFVFFVRENINKINKFYFEYQEKQGF